MMTRRGKVPAIGTVAATALFSVLAWSSTSCTGPPERVYRGTYLSGFELSDFIPEGSDPLLERWWLAGDIREISSHIGTLGSPVFVTVQGELSRPGGYGHLGSYKRQLTVTHVLEVRQIQ